MRHPASVCLNSGVFVCVLVHCNQRHIYLFGAEILLTLLGVVKLVGIIDKL